MLVITPKYYNKWIAIKNEKVIASDDDYEKLKEKTRKIKERSKSTVYYTYFPSAYC